MTTTTTNDTTDARSAQARAMLDGRRAESLRRRQRVLTALERAITQGAEIGVSAIARTAGVDRSFLYRHRDLLEKIHAAEAEPPSSASTSPTVTRASLQADLLAAHERVARIHSRNQQLEKRLSEALGEQVWQESGLGAPTDIDALQHQITQLEQQAAELLIQLEEREEDLTAARATNRELMARINTPRTNQ